MPTVKKLTLRAERVKVAEGAEPYGRRVLSSSNVAPFLRGLLGHEPAEVFVLLALDVKNVVLGYHEVARGGLSSCSVEPAQVFKLALLADAASLILAHNHPSGDCSPSADDVMVTRRIVDGARLFGIRVLDHIIVGDPGHFSFLDAGMLSAGGAP